MRYLFIILGLACLSGSGTSLRAAEFSDDFSVGQPSSTNNTAGPGFDSGTSLATAYGNRQLYTYVSSNTAPGDARGRTAVDNGHFTFSSDEEVSALGFAAYSFSTPLDFSNKPDFEFSILSNDQVGSLYFTLIDGSDAVGQVSVALPVVSSSGPPLTLVVVPDYTSVDDSDITNIEFAAGGAFGEDLSIDSFTSLNVPEPGSLGLFALAGISLVAVAVARRFGRPGTASVA